MHKKDFRNKMAAQRNALSAVARQKKSGAICAHLLQSDAYCTAARIFTFLSIGSEPDTHTLISKALADNKEVAVPVTGANGEMHFALITTGTELHKTKYGTLEPLCAPKDAVIPCKTDLFLVPGLAFDVRGNRYGYGGGFYDRYLAKHPQICPIALAFQLQICAKPLAPQPHDMPMQYIISEAGWITCQ